MSITAVCVDGPLRGLVCQFRHVRPVKRKEGDTVCWQILPPDQPPATPQGTYAMLELGKLVWAGNAQHR